jgi:plastocyanin
LIQKIRHHLKKRKEDIFHKDSHIDWEFVISVALAVIFGLVAFNFFLRSSWGAGIGALVVAFFLLIPEETISRRIRMKFTWKHKAIILILIVIAGYFYFQGGDESGPMEVQIPTEAEAGTDVIEEGTDIATGSDTSAADAADTTQEAIEEQPTPIGQAFEIEMTDHLEPADLTISAGATVVWKNLQKRPHLIHIYTRNGGYETVAVGDKIGLVGDSWEFTFTEPGVFLYRDTVFNWRGTITVE